MMREASAWGSLEALNQSTRAGVARAATCDRTIYHDAIRRLGLPPPTNAGEALDRSLCERAAY